MTAVCEPQAAKLKGTRGHNCSTRTVAEGCTRPCSTPFSLVGISN